MSASSRPSRARPARAQSTIAGATINAPAKSQSHQVIHMSGSWGSSASPATRRLATPMVALIGVAMTRQMRAKRMTCPGFSNASVPRAQRRVKRAATSASSVFPKPIAMELGRSPVVVWLASHAPRKMAGAASGPSRSSAAIASPVGGQTGVALGLIEASVSPALANRK